MEKTKFERGKSLTYPRYFPKLTFTPIFGRRGDFVWVEEVKGAWPEYDSEFTFVRSTVHDQRVDSLKAENAKLREYAESYAKAVECEGCGWCPYDIDAVCDTETIPMRDGCKLYDELRELGIEVNDD